MLLPTLIKQVLRTLALIDITAISMFALYASMHSTVTHSNATTEFLIISLVLRIVLFLSNISAIKIPPSGRFFYILSAVLIFFLSTYGGYMIFLISNQTYLITTMIMHSIFLVLDFAFIITLFLILIQRDSDWKYYIDTHNEKWDIYWDLPLVVADGHKGRHIVGLIYTILPIESTILIFYIMTQASNGLTNPNGWFFVMHIATISVTAAYFYSDLDPEGTTDLFVTMGSFVFIVFLFDFFQLLMTAVDFYPLVYMRSLLLFITITYLAAFIVKTYNVKTSFVYDRVKLLYFATSVVIFSVATIEFFSVLGYVCYLDATRNQHPIYTNYLHLATSAFATSFYLAGSGDLNAARWKWITRGSTSGSIAFLGNLLLVTSIFVMYSDSVAVGIFPTELYRTSAELWIQIAFLTESIIYVLLLLIIWPLFNTFEFVLQYGIVISTMTNITNMFDDPIKRFNYIMRRVIIYISYADFAFINFYVYTLVDGTAYRWFDYFVVVHYLTIVIAWIGLFAPFSLVEMRIQCILILSIAIIALIIDIVMLALASTAAPHGMLDLRIFLVVSNVSYIFACVVALVGTDIAVDQVLLTDNKNK